jgi:stage IV sporulation protein FB
MRYSDRGLDNPINWSFRIGRLFDINIRIHIAFVLCAVVLVAMEFPRDGVTTVPFGTAVVHALGTYAILFVIVLLHEFGHCYGARRTGGEADEILIWPLGGLASTRPPHHPTAHLVTTLAGPAVNVIICVGIALILVAWTGRIGAVPRNPLHPFTPTDPAVALYATSAQTWLIRVFGISYLLLLFNLLPIFPFDGGRILQSYLWARKDYVTSMEIATFTGMVGAILVGLFGLFIKESWILWMIAVFGYVTCWQTRRMVREYGDPGTGEFGYDFSRGYQTFDEYEPRPRRMGWLKRRRLRRAAIQAERERQCERERHKQVEEILRKVAQTGLESLSPAERHLLEEETARRRALSGDGSEI